MEQEGNVATKIAGLAGACVFLASRANARGVTGSMISVDAGWTLRMPRRRLTTSVVILKQTREGGDDKCEGHSVVQRTISR
jgi:hypothetical protein